MLEPSSLFTDGAVLAREKEIRIFGRADSGETVTARLEDRRGSVLAEATAEAREGRFLAFLPPQRAQTGCRLTLRCGGETFGAEDIAIGDVYLAGGQSNMELELRGALGGPEALPEDPLVRFFNVPKIARTCEEQERALAGTRWKPVNAESAGYNSAVASWFAAEMRGKHPEIPVGIIGCYWGGTSATCWMDRETLESISEGIRYLREYGEKSGDKTLETYLEEEKEFNRVLGEWNAAADAFRAEHPGEPFTELEKACGKCPWNPPAGPGSPYRPAGLAESMLKQVMPVALTAILYYQGEEDADKTDRYDQLMTALIGFWRKGFREAELPFLFVQLPMWIDDGAQDSFRWPALRLAQAAVRDSVRNTGMICLLDQGEYGNIHPVNKEPVGKRLAELAEQMLRGRGEESPRAIGRWVRGETMHVVLSREVTTPDGEAPRLLEIAGADGRFVPAEAEISEKMLRIRSEQVAHPAAARYAWTDYSDRVNLFGENGLPLEPFLL